MKEKEIRYQIHSTKAKLPTTTMEFLDAIDTIYHAMSYRISPTQRNLIRRNIALLFRFIQTTASSIEKTHPNLIRDDLFIREISKGLSRLKIIHDFYGKVPGDSDTDKKQLKKEVKQLPNFSKTPKPIELQQEAVEKLLFANSLSRLISLKFSGV